ncbi:MAG: succinate dehydrogenase assembly factor 2 [Tistlia sp.]|uniref:succinate dehydrogenase assembly factor 2 n=1 Tax=Tistlia sp. TaxID=3057121 RepID=UPI0034A441A7
MTGQDPARETMRAQSAEAPESLEVRRKRLRFRSWHRGTREMDLLVGSFADRHLAGFDSGQLDRYEALLLEPDPDLYNWMIGAAEPPGALDHDVMKLLRSFKYHP